MFRIFTVTLSKCLFIEGSNELWMMYEKWKYICVYIEHLYKFYEAKEPFLGFTFKLAENELMLVIKRLTQLRFIPISLILLFFTEKKLLFASNLFVVA